MILISRAVMEKLVHSDVEQILKSTDKQMKILTVQ